jgi:hypothetical protein
VSHLFEGIGEDEPIGEKGAFLGAAASYEVDFANVLMDTPADALVIATAKIPEKFFYAPFPILEALGSENRATRPRADMVYFETECSIALDRECSAILQIRAAQSSVRSSYGVLQLPPAGGAHGLLLAVTADQVAEYAHHGYAVVAIGLKGQVESGLHWRRLTSLLRQRNSALPPRHVIAPKIDAEEEARRLAGFLDSHDIPEDEKRRWRV